MNISKRTKNNKQIAGVAVLNRILLVLLLGLGLWLPLAANQAHAQGGTRTWFVEDVRFDSGAVASGSFDYDPEPYNPLGGQYGTYSNIQIDLTNPDGSVVEFRIVNPASRGNSRYVSVVAATGGDLTGKPFMALTPAVEMSSEGGFINILPGPQDLSYVGVCRQANCGPADAPYQEATGAGRIAAAHRLSGTRTWYLDNVRFDSGAVATGSFDYNTEPFAPLGGQYGTYSNINIDVTSPDGTVKKFRRVNPASRGNARYVSLVAAFRLGEDQLPEDDLTGKAFMALTPAVDMTNAGGVIDILPGPQDLSYVGVCRLANCGPADAPYEEALAGGRIIAGPRTWHLDNVRLDSGAVATGWFTYDQQPYNPLGGQYGTYSNINIDVTNPDGAVRNFSIVNPASRGNARYVSVVGGIPRDDVDLPILPAGDLAGKPFLALTPDVSMTNQGGIVNILPGPQDLSYVGVCRQANCGPADAPYEEALAGGRLLSVPGPQTWYLEGVRFDSGARATGSFDYDEQPYAPLGGLYGTYSNINVDVISPNGTVREFRIVNPASRGNARYVSLVAAAGGDLTGAPFMALTPAFNMTNAATRPLAILPGPQDLSYVGVCRQANCGPADAPYEEALVGGRITRFVAPPTIDSAATASAAENQTSVIDVNATDNLDSEGNGLVFSISGGADQALFNIDVNTGLVTFAAAPDFEAPGDANGDNAYILQIRVTDLGGRNAVQDLLVTVTDVAENSGPTITSSATAFTAENQTTAIDVQATDSSDSEGAGLTFAITGGADAALFGIDASSGVVSFAAAPDFEVPGDANADNNYSIQVTVTDSGGLTAVQDVVITVTDVVENTAPIITSSAAAFAAEGQTTAIDVQATDDSDSEGSGLGFAITGGADAALFSIDSATGVVTFVSAPDFEVPADANGDNDYSIQVAVTDSGGLSALQNVLVTVTDVAENSAPVLSAIGNQSVAEGQQLAFTVSATDADGDTLTFSLGNPPTGAVLADNGNGTASFQWTPTFDQGGNFPDVLFTVTDNGSPMLADSEVITITVGDVNRPPQFDSLASQGTDEGVELSFMVRATDPDGDSIVLSASNAPTGATFTDNGDGSGTFTWTPDFGQEGNFTVMFAAADSGMPAQGGSLDVSINVGSVNRAPVLDMIGNRTLLEGEPLEITLIANDADGDTLSYSVANEPTGSTLADNGDGTATFSWTPGFDQAGNFADVLFTVIDDGVPSASDSEAVTITVGDANRAPVLSEIGAQTVSEGGLLDLVLTASDPDGNNLSFPVPVDLPAGATFVDNSDGTANFSWMPGFDQGGNADVSFRVEDDGTPLASDDETVMISVGDVNRPPTLGPIGDRDVDAGELLEFTLVGNDPDGDALSFEADGLPSGATFDDDGDGTARLSWLPAADQIGAFEVTFYVADNGTPSESDLESVTITVNATGGEPIASCGEYDVFETEPGVFESPDFDGAVILGSDRRDVIFGTNGPDLILALGGNDKVFSRGGNDLVCSGAGSDIVYGGRGDDVVYGGGRTDLLVGGRGDDALFGEGGRDYLYGGRDEDTLNGGAGRDRCSGGPGRDTKTACER